MAVSKKVARSLNYHCWKGQCWNTRLVSRQLSISPVREGSNRLNVGYIPIYSNGEFAPAIEAPQTWHHLALVPSLPHFDLPFAFTIIQKIGEKLKQERPGSIHHVNDVRWTLGGCRREGPNCQNNIHLSALPCFWTPDFSVMETTRKLLVTSTYNCTL